MRAGASDDELAVLIEATVAGKWAGHGISGHLLPASPLHVPDRGLAPRAEPPAGSVRRRSSVKRTFPLLVLALVLLGCGSDDPDTPATSDPAPGRPRAHDRSRSGGVRTSDRHAHARARRPNRSAIDSVQLTAENKLEVRFYNGVLECYGVDRVEVEETDTDVTVTVFTGAIPADPAQACIELAQLQAVVVTLDADLGDRVVVDGSTGAA